MSDKEPTYIIRSKAIPSIQIQLKVMETGELAIARNYGMEIIKVEGYFSNDIPLTHIPKTNDPEETQP